MKKQKENSHEGITWSEMGKQNAQAEKVTPKSFGAFERQALGRILCMMGVMLSKKCEFVNWWAVLGLNQSAL